MGFANSSYAARPPPFCMYTDYMHTYVASGGLAQYELNGFVLPPESHTCYINRIRFDFEPSTYMVMFVLFVVAVPKAGN